MRISLPEDDGSLHLYRMKIRLPVCELSSTLTSAEMSGDWKGEITGIASLAQAGAGDLSFLGNPRYAREVAASRASVVLLPRNFQGEPAENQLFVRVDNPSLALAIVCERIEAQLRRPPEPGIHPTAVVDSSAQIDATASIGPFCTVEPGVVIGAHSVLHAHVHLDRDVRLGEDCRLYPQTTVYRGSELGNRVVLHAGVVVGSDGFGYESGPEGHRKVPQIGRVVIEDDVEVGANSTIDRARLEETRIGQGTKIDNLVQIGHNVRIGRHCFLCALAGISGSTRIGDFVVMAGQSGTVGHIEIGDRSQVGGQAGLAKNLRPGSIVTGTPATDFQRQRRLEALIRRLPQLFDRVRELESLLPPLPSPADSARSFK